ncbi:MAG: cyclic nucleotide-binding domain-containing protein [Gammaproteobacteria bacterium]|nr:cyclic nucleotide-binding domain-containing protein [Gammaproteobacteria bacterium]
MPGTAKETYLDRFKRLDPISTLGQDMLAEIAGQTRIERIDPGVVLFREGEDSHQLLYILSGSVELSSSAQQHTRLIKGGTAEATQPADQRNPHQYCATTVTPAVIARVERHLVEAMLTWGQISVPETEVMMSEDGIITINKADWLKIMMKSPTFRQLPASNIAELLQRLEPVRVRAGDVIIRQGDIGDYFYMLNEGTALVTRNPDDDEDSVEMAELQEGTTFGEAALLSDKPRGATVSMTSDGILLRLAKEDFNLLLKQPTLHELSFDEALHQINDRSLWIDVRLPDEYQRGHLPQARNIPMRDLYRQAHALDPTRTYLCYCDNGQRSAAATFTLTQYGIQAYTLKGGLNRLPPGQLSQ